MVSIFIWLIFSSFCYILGEVFSKKYALDLNIKWAVFALLAYTAQAILWLKTFRNDGRLIIISTISGLICLLMTFLLGYFIFNERISPINYLGLIFAAFAVVLLSW